MTTKNNMNAVEDYTSAKIQKDLAAGILKQATQDLRRFRNRDQRESSGNFISMLITGSDRTIIPGRFHS